ncbi:MAG: rhodanese-like domain-containing protein [Verrucomicrobia bacterium]|nr:rhodanese-like domain-containing protein [Verrucomicrobiota bacterium]
MNPFKMFKSMFTPVPRLEPLSCASRIREGEAFLVDVREPDEWRAGVAQRARLLPLSDLTGSRAQWRKFLAEAKDREIYLYCASGGRSGLAARLLAGEGFRTANTGGLGDWADAGWPVVKPGRS